MKMIKVRDDERRTCLRSNRNIDDLTDEEKKIVQKLAVRSYHLPGYTFWQDWWQYFFNNHPIFGLCFHHTLHPIGFRERIVFLVGSIACGLAATSGVIIWYYAEGLELNVTAIEVRVNNVLSEDQGDLEVFEITNGMISCWTIAGLINSAFDIFLWYVTACPCCQVGGFCYKNTTCSKLGANIANAIVVILSFGCLCIVMYRVHLEAEGDIEQRHFSFLQAYLVSTGLNLLVYRPVISFLLFTGVLGCFRLPFLGGRPRSKRLQNQYNEDVEAPDDEYICYEENNDPQGLDSKRGEV